MANELANRMGVQPQNFLSYPYPLNYAPPLSQVAPVIPPDSGGVMSRMAARIFGSEPARVPFNQAYPNAQDVYYAQAYDQTYGTPMAGFTVPGAKVAKIPLNEVLGSSPSEVLKNARVQEMSDEDRDVFLQNYIAAQKHPVSAIGYDPRNITYTPKVAGEDVNIEGFHSPSNDALWYYGKNQDTVVHEAFHRGIEKLKDAGVLPASLKNLDNETLVRMLMLKNFGDIEVLPNAEDGNRQVQRAKSRFEYFPVESRQQLEALEKAAQEYIAKKTPRGPR